VSSAGGPRRLTVTGPGTRSEAYSALDWGLLATTSLIWGASFLFIAVGLRALEPGVIAAARVMLGAGALALFRRSRVSIATEDWARVAMIGVAGQAGPALLFALAEQHIESAVAGMLVSTVPIVTVILVVAATRRLPGRMQLVGLGVGFIGVVALTSPLVGETSSSLLGIGFVLLAVLGYAMTNLLAPPLQQTYGSLPVMMWALVVASVLLAPLGLLGLGDSSFRADSVLAVLVLGVVGTGFARAIHLTLIGRVGPSRGTLAGYFIPVIALVLGVVFLDDTVEVIQIFGVALALSGSYLVSRRDARQQAAAEAEAALRGIS